jgi:hypothetical protein
MTTRYVVIVFGEDGAPFRQATMLLVSLVAFAPPPREFVLVTDHPERFSWFAGTARVEPLSAASLDAWRGGSEGWRHKLEVERALLPAQGALVLLDADTLAVRPLEPFVDALSGGSLFLHKQEYVLSESRRAGNRKLWEQVRGRSFNGWEIDERDAMWNAGVVACTSRDSGLIDRAIELHDRMAETVGRHLFLEQLATSSVFGRTGRLMPAMEFFAHYWGNKEGYDRELSARIAAWTAAGTSVPDAAASYRARPINLPVEVRPGKLQKIATWLGR